MPLAIGADCVGPIEQLPFASARPCLRTASRAGRRPLALAGLTSAPTLRFIVSHDFVRTCQMPRPILPLDIPADPSWAAHGMGRACAAGPGARLKQEGPGSPSVRCAHVVGASSASAGHAGSIARGLGQSLRPGQFPNSPEKKSDCFCGRPRRGSRGGSSLLATTSGGSGLPPRAADMRLS